MTEVTYTKKALEKRLDSIVSETLGDIDVNGAFGKTINNPKVTGIAGDVIEKSVLGYDSNSIQEPDIIVDNKRTEVKTTGIRYSTSSLKKGKQSNKDFEAKEPMSITAVSPDKIVNESFENSNFWHKLNYLLLVFYHYDSQSPVKSWEYKDFVVKGYEFHEFSDTEKQALKNDWEKVKSFILDAQKSYMDPTERYPFLGAELRKNLLFIDTAPKWPHNPRFRLKRSTVTAIVQQYFGKKLEELPAEYDSFHDIDEKLHEISDKFKGKTVRELISYYGIKIQKNKDGDASKNVSEQIMVRMFGGTSKKLSQIDLFKKAGITLKTLTQTRQGKRTEDTKLFPIDFERLVSDADFESSEFSEFFSEKQFIFIVFEEPSGDAKLLDNKFVGFKRLSFGDDFIQDQVKYAWMNTKKLVEQDLLVEKQVLNQKTKKPITNKNGTIRTTLNFLKSKQNVVFVRGSGVDSSKKPLFLNGIHMYTQYIWVKGDYLVRLLSKESFI